ncbi:MAG: hypothetical protein C0429_17805 [Sphingopyxis sp.]|nr:hypothetical protein [Sphingopyxis sp.]
MTMILSGAIAFLIMFIAYRLFAGGTGMAFDKDDPRLVEAKQQARATLPQFWAALEARDPATRDFMLKFNLNHGTGHRDNESIWACDIRRDVGRIFGSLANHPRNPAYREGQEVEIAPEAIDDWGYFRGSVAQGHHVSRLMIETAPAGTARMQRQAMGW